MRIKSLLRQSVFVDNYLRELRIRDWIRAGRPIPVSHEIKQLTILYYSSIGGLDTLVETGTFFGDTIWTQKEYFKRIYSIELSAELFERAKQRFKKFDHITLLSGDSSEKLGEVLAEIDSPVLFWLDGHYSGGITAKGEKECPIFAELEHIFASPLLHTVLIDDARLFVGKDDYPTMDELGSFISENSNYNMKVENDIIILTTGKVR